jgi:hypothetical protein
VLQAALDAGAGAWSFAAGPRAARAALADYAALLKKFREKQVTAKRKEFCAWEVAEEAAGRSTEHVQPPDWDRVVARQVHGGVEGVAAAAKRALAGGWAVAAARDELAAEAAAEEVDA